MGVGLVMVGVGLGLVVVGVGLGLVVVGVGLGLVVVGVGLGLVVVGVGLGVLEAGVKAATTAYQSVLLARVAVPTWAPAAPLVMSSSYAEPLDVLARSV